MSAPNKATEMIAQFAIDWLSDWDIESDMLSAESIQNDLKEMATDILACEPEYDNDQPFPEWTTLVMTPAIANTIDYNWVLQRVCETLFN